MAVEVVNRTLHKMENDDLIWIVRHRIEIMDWDGLERRAETRNQPN